MMSQNEKVEIPKYYISVWSDPILRKRKKLVLCPTATKVSIPGFEAYDFFIHRPYIPCIKNDKGVAKWADGWGQKGWAISEATTGHAITYGFLIATKTAVLDDARNILIAHQQDLDCAIAKIKVKTPFNTVLERRKLCTNQVER